MFSPLSKIEEKQSLPLVVINTSLLFCTSVNSLFQTCKCNHDVIIYTCNKIVTAFASECKGAFDYNYSLTRIIFLGNETSIK